MVPMDSRALLQSQWIHGHCCGADGFTVIFAVPMDSWSLLWCRWIHGNCCGADGFTKIVAELMDSHALLQLRDSCSMLCNRLIHVQWCIIVEPSLFGMAPALLASCPSFQSQIK